MQCEALPTIEGSLPQPFQNRIHRLASHHHPCPLMNALPVSHPHYPFAPHYILASLVKGEVLLPERIRATTGGIATPLPHTAPTHPKPHYPLAQHHVLASLVKGRWIDGKAQALILLLSVCDTPTFFYLSNFSAVKTEGLQHHSLAPHQHPCLPSKKGRWLDGKAQA